MAYYPPDDPQNGMIPPGFGQGMQGMFGGLKRGFRGGANALNPYSNRLLGFSAGMLGSGPSGAMKGLIAGSALDRESADRKRLNEAIAALQSDPDSSLLSGLSEAEQNYVAQDPAALRALIVGKFGGSVGGAETFGMGGVYGYDKDGNAVFMQPSNRGGLQQAELPPDVTLSPPGNRTVDTGMEVITYDRAGNEISRTPKQPGEVRRQQAEGERQGSIDIPAIESDAVTMKTMIADVLNDPVRANRTGWQSNFPAPRGTPAYEFEQKHKQLQGQVFKQAFESLKGAGQITVQEGEAATRAFSRLDTGLGDEAYVAALKDLDALVDILVKRAHARAGQPAETGNDDPLGLR